MKYYYDLHIHTCLSPCGDVLMTPNNILNMAYLKGLNIIAITDHNSTLQLPSIMELAQSYDILVIPGVEVETIEKYHIVCLFRNLEKAKEFQTILENFIEKKEYDKEKYGYEQVLDVNDEIVNDLDYYLVVSTSLNAQMLNKIVKKLKGVLILAHPHKYNNQDTTEEFINLFDGIEKNKKDENCIYNQKKKVIISSDAHQITDILECVSSIELDELSVEAFFKYMEN